jgi:hypothetical protein
MGLVDAFVYELIIGSVLVFLRRFFVDGFLLQIVGIPYSLIDTKIRLFRMDFL